MNVSSKIVALGALLLTLMVGTAGAAGLRDSPDYSYQTKRDVTNLIVETSACPGFATSSPLRFSGTLFAAYSHWNSDESEQGFAFINVTARDGQHRYRITQLYLFPRQYREYVYGWARTWVVRDDHAMMVGASWLGIQVPYLGGYAEGVWWTGTPTCIPPRH